MDASLGMQFGRYLLRERLGTGGMASVWRALDGDGRALVVKRMLPSLASDAEFVAMFDREAALSARLTHPNIVRVVDHGSYEGERYLAMEELHGRDLGTVMMELAKRSEPPPPGFGAFVALAVARALAYVHALTGDDGAPDGGALDDGETLLSPAGVTLEALRRRRAPARSWRLVIAALVAAILGGATGWQLTQARAGAVRTSPASRAP